ncbi:uncharacterized protein LOC122502776 [Leptopilina heterotoma]|uniref:uncharacterized protein LOC122502776 n=1 Tax=Leptopilina heterotoma TaxID=63436 RepID=UPI001CA964AA|nr:uncharacterized protein LOC122502776 [Leptopilina heterotoma]XP_043468915.1 uncharacterized protein LOC122502776 [Leptopilina heterotoma]XP_043468916.1 uncharacterized protein LOC122502776 [Leptopilina heterotoma]XP_043468917.1 uncharacterized protein LOC122502776 [Leptopilina heterotoma]
MEDRQTNSVVGENETKSPSPGPTVTNTLNTMQPPILTVTSGRILRSPSHESVTTDLSLFSVSSIASDAKCGNRLVTFKSYSDVQLSARDPSPNPDSRQIQGNRPADIPESIWFEEETDLIRSCGALSSALGLQKSFSTSDVSQLPSPEAYGPRGLRSAVSAHALDFAHRNNLILEHAGLDHASRSCSTWVAVGDVASTSQLPSPHGGCEQPPLTAPHPPTIPFTAADLVRSVNKKVRQNYIRRRLLTTYRALERLSQSEFNLDRLEAAASAAQIAPGATLVVPGAPVVAVGRKSKDHALTVKDVERERGKQLSKYERNMMIFNWLHTLDDTVEESLQ